MTLHQIQMMRQMIMRVMRKPDKVIRINCTDDELYDLWIEFTRPYHHLTEREGDMAAEFLRQRSALVARTGNEALADELLMSENTKAKIRQKCGMSMSYYQINMSKLRKAGFILGEKEFQKINPRFIPDTVEKDGKFIMQFIFNIRNSVTDD